MLAAPLIDLLNSEDIKPIIKQHEATDKQAGIAQKYYKKWGKREIFATMTATVLGAFALLQPQLIFGNTTIRGVTVVIQFTALALVFLAAWWLRKKSYLEKWQAWRGKAENARVSLFDTLMRLRGQEGASALPLLPLKLEYFRRYQLDVQRRYYKERGAEHAKGAFKSFSWRWFSRIIYLVAILLTIPASLMLLNKLGWVNFPWLVDLISQHPALGEFADMADKSLLGIGVITSAIHGASIARTRMDMDERNAARYKMTSRNLEYLTDTGLHKARLAAIEGDEKTVLDFIQKVQRQISAEHQEWVILKEVEKENLV